MRRLIFIGDLHRSFTWLEKTVFEYENADIILLGDIEFQFENKDWLKWFQTFNNEIAKHNIHLYAIRGNHDNPFYWFDQKYTFTNVHLVQDYTVLNLKYNVLCVGGATSIDRIYQGKKYHKEEEFVYDEDFCNGVRDIDVVVTHSAPDLCHPKGFDNHFLQQYYDYDKELRSDLVCERVLITRMFDVLRKNNNIKLWTYGHFHDSNIENIFGTQFMLLDICDIYELD